MITENVVREQLFTELAQQGYQGRLVSARHLQDLAAGLDTLRREGQFNDEFYQERLTFLCYSPPAEGLSQAQSLIIVAVPRPQTAAVFNWRGRSLSLIIPPTYTAYKKIVGQVTHLVADILEPAGYRVAQSFLPLKLLAVQSGLGAYGRNNVCYVPGMGSFVELVGLYSDLPCADETWQEPQMMAACQNCIACRHHCPTGAISAERFLLYAERCLVFHNERPGSVPFPTWIEPAWHNCLEGCMHCQWVCPANKNLRGWVEEREEFSEEETKLLLRGEPQDGLSKETLDKLERLDILGDLNTLPRNLGVFLN
jgi:epoxyqueuosine reductase